MERGPGVLFVGRAEFYWSWRVRIDQAQNQEIDACYTHCIRRESEDLGWSAFVSQNYQLPRSVRNFNSGSTVSHQRLKAGTFLEYTQVPEYLRQRPISLAGRA